MFEPLKFATIKLQNSWQSDNIFDEKNIMTYRKIDLGNNKKRKKTYLLKAFDLLFDDSDL
jgi:hypothetical protein